MIYNTALLTFNNGSASLQQHKASAHPQACRANQQRSQGAP